MTLASWRSLSALVLMLMLGIGLEMFLMPSPHASVQARHRDPPGCSDSGTGPSRQSHP